jgi:hypothetical protein
MSDAKDLARARADAANARERLLGAAQAVQARLKPASLASDAWETVRDKSEVVAEGAARAVAKRPAIASAAALGVVALLARKPIARLFGRFRKNHED